MALTVTGVAIAFAGTAAVATAPWACKLKVRQIAVSNAVHWNEWVEFIWGEVVFLVL